MSGGATYVQSGAELDIQNSIALGNSGGKTLYLNGTGTGTAGALRNVSGTNSDAGTVILQTNTTIGVDANTLTLSGVVSGAGTSSLTKVGAGTLALSGANTFTGGTTVNAGTLLVNNTSGSGTGTGTLNIASGGSLGGTGTIGSVTTIAGALGVSGASPGILTFSSGVTLQTGSATTININGSTTRGTDYDGITFNGGVTITGGTLTFNIGVPIASGSVLNIFIPATVSSTFTSVTATGIGGYSGSFSLGPGNTSYIYNYGGQVVTLDLPSGDLIFAIPEPSTYAAIFGALTLLAASCRRRRA